jgi:DNA-binding response OmpR family regulator
MVLVADDDGGMVDTLVDILSANGYDVAGVYSGGTAISMVGDSHYDVALMVTAFTGDEPIEEARRASAVEILFKSFDIARSLDLTSSSARLGGAQGACA